MHVIQTRAENPARSPASFVAAHNGDAVTFGELPKVDVYWV